MRKLALLLAAVILLSLQACHAADKTVVIIKGKQIQVEVPRTKEEITKGLMFREFLGHDEGMLFVFEKDVYPTFWMKNTTIPLSLAFIDKDKIIISIQKMKPLDTTIRYYSPSKCRYALEVNQGFFEENGIQVGDVVEFKGL
jgi:uncharacterized membrane protein (UPF0127 family)